jgi:hypothetical protein
MQFIIVICGGGGGGGSSSSGSSGCCCCCNNSVSVLLRSYQNTIMFGTKTEIYIYKMKLRIHRQMFQTTVRDVSNVVTL